MASQSSEKEISYVLQLSQSTEDSSMIINEESTLAPVIIEELEESQMTLMNVDINEFVEAKALEVCQVNSDEVIEDPSLNDYELDLSDNDDNYVLTPEEQNRLTKQFLSGELTFSEYSSRMDTDVDGEERDADMLCPTTRNEVMKIEPSSSDEKNEVKKVRRRKTRRTLPAALLGLVGEANVRFARGETELATRMCFEVIRQAPYAPEPFETLAEIHATDSPDKALQFSLIAAHLRPKNAEQWVRLAGLSLDARNLKQAVTCYSRAIQESPKNVQLYEARAMLQEQAGDTKASLKGYVKLINQLGPEDGEDVVKYAKMLTKKFMTEKSYDQALESMEQIFNKCPNLVSLQEVNIMSEILIAMRNFHKCLEILSKYTEVCIKYKDSATLKDNEADITDGKNSQSLVIESCQVPDTVVGDLKAKLMVALIELDFVTKADELSNTFLANEDPEISGDLFLDIADALMGKKEYSRALKFLEPLINNQSYSLAAVWLRYAECWVGCKQLKKAILSYEIVTKLSPQHIEARLQLSTLYKCFKQYDLALEILNQDPTAEVLDAVVLHRRTLLLYKMENHDEFLKSGWLLVLRHCVNLRTKAELETLMRTTVRQRIEALHLHRLTRAEPLDDECKPVFSIGNEPSLKDEFNLFLKMCEVTCKLQKYGMLERMCFTALTSKRFEPKTGHIIFLCLLACIYNSNSFYAYNLVRELVRDCRKSNLWNLLDIVIQRCDDSRHNRFLMRLLSREDAFSYRHILNANNCLVSGTYKYALNDYVFLFRIEPSALLALLIAVTFLQMACQKFAAKKHRLVTQAYAFFKKYEQMRGPEGKQEADYNIGRALHQLGFLSGALHFYKLVLESSTPKIVEDNTDLLNLKKEAAFNIHLIYMYSGNLDLARMYLDDYVVV